MDLESALREMYSRGRAVPGGACGFWGARGAGISAGRFLAAVDFVRERLGVELARSVPVCTCSARNGQCIGRRCPFSAVR